MTTAAILFACASWWLFVAWYWVRATWWKGVVGINTQIVSIVVALILTRLSVVRIAPSLKDFEVFGMLVYVAAGLLALQRIYFVEKEQRLQPDLEDSTERNT